MSEYRLLEKGEIIQGGDELDGCCDPWRDAPEWVPAGSVGEPAPDPRYPAHRKYRRRVFSCCECGEKFDTLSPPAETRPDDPSPTCGRCIEKMLNIADVTPLNELEVARILRDVCH